MEWSPQQASALKAVAAWLADRKRKQVFRLWGTAGTGKTTLAREVAAMVNGRVLVGAFTGKASLCLRKKGLFSAQTLHSMIYKPVETPTGEVKFELNPDCDLRGAALLIVDEVSMVDQSLGADILSFRAPILVLGDPGQLPPIRGAGFFDSPTPDVMLTEIHRQAAENPIIQMSMEVREGRRLKHGQYGESRVISRADLKQEDVLEADQVICGLNRTRRAFNRRIREIRGHKDPMPSPAERLICLKNDREFGLLNGGMWTVDAVAKKGEWVKMLLASQDDPGIRDLVQVEVLENFFNDTEDQLTVWQKRESDQFAYGYVITCHKAQGSEWGRVLVFDESAVFGQDAARWLYTAITRAADRITIVV